MIGVSAAQENGVMALASKGGDREKSKNERGGRNSKAHNGKTKVEGMDTPNTDERGPRDNKGRNPVERVQDQGLLYSPTVRGGNEGWSVDYKFEWTSEVIYKDSQQ